MPTTFYTYTISFRCIYGRYLCLYSKVSGIDNVTTMYCTGTYKLQFILWTCILTKCDRHITNITYAALILYWHMVPTLAHICTKTQPTTISTFHVIAILMLETQEPTKLHIHTIYLMGIYGDVCTCKYTYEVTDINHVTTSTALIISNYI